MPAITALAGLVPCADVGMRQVVAVRVAARAMLGADHEQPGILALRAGVRLQRHRGEPGDLGQLVLELLEHAGRSPPPGRAGANGCSRLNSGQLTGIISVVALSFIVQEPSGIMALVSDRSRASSRLM